MKIIQMTHTLTHGDAIGNNIIALKHLFNEMGHTSLVYASRINGKFESGVSKFSNKLSFDKDDILIYHMSIGCDLNDMVHNFACRKIMVYHNITPSFFFEPYNAETAACCSRGRKQLAQMKDTFEHIICVSEYNKKDLIETGFAADNISVLPIFIDTDSYKTAPDEKVMQLMDKNRRTFLFVGRIAPNKKIENVIRVFTHYKKHYENNARLFIVGGGTGQPYHSDLCAYSKAINADDAVFTGRISFPELIAYYKISDAFLCMSEHEGFCVPIIEAMIMGLPVAAYLTTAIPYTLNGSGIGLEKNEPAYVSKVLDRLFNDKPFYDAVIRSQEERISYFDISNQKEQYRSFFTKLLSDIL